jgi:hypothetical protein
MVPPSSVPLVLGVAEGPHAGSTQARIKATARLRISLLFTAGRDVISDPPVTFRTFAKAEYSTL